jgi:hypothetical protein
VGSYEPDALSKSTPTLPQFLRTDEPPCRDGREVFDFFRRFGPIQRIEAAANLGRSHPVAVVHFKHLGDAIAAENAMNASHSEMGTLNAFDPCSISCFVSVMAFKFYNMHIEY